MVDNVNNYEELVIYNVFTNPDTKIDYIVGDLRIPISNTKLVMLITFWDGITNRVSQFRINNNILAIELFKNISHIAVWGVTKIK